MRDGVPRGWSGSWRADVEQLPQSICVFSRFLLPLHRQAKRSGIWKTPFGKHRLEPFGLRARRLKSTLFKSGEPNRRLTPILRKSIAIHLPFLSRYFCKSIALLLAQNIVYIYIPPLCITIRLPVVSQYFCRSIRVRGRWHTPNVRGPHMGGQIRRGWIWRFWGAPIFCPEVRGPQTSIFKGFWDLWTENRGAPKNAKFNRDASQPPFAALWQSRWMSLRKPFQVSRVSPENSQALWHICLECQPKACWLGFYLGKRKHTPPCSSAELFFAKKKRGPQRKDFGGRYGFPGFHRV